VSRRAAYLAACASLVALTIGCLVWELWLAPLRPGGSWLALKALPLLAPLRGVLRGRVYTYRWAMLLILPYFAEGVVRAWSERGAPAQLALAEAILAVSFFCAAIAYVRSRGK
jgi:uncharacterized membrane protein